MSPQDAYEALKPIFNAIVEKDYIKRLHSPANIIADGNEQIIVAKQDSNILVREGMNVMLITEVEQALHAFSWASSLHDTLAASSNEIKAEWQELKIEGYAIRKELFRYGSFGCKKNKLPRVEKELKEIMEGIGDDDLIYDLLQCSQLFTTHPYIYAGLPTFDSSWVTKALELHNKLSTLKAKVKNPETEEMLDTYAAEVRQSYSLYHKKVYELRDWGNFVFDGDERQDKYKSQFRRKN